MATSCTPKLNAAQRRFVVRCFAHFMSVSQVREALVEQFEVDATLQALSYYNPGTVAGRKLNPELRALFYSEREEYLTSEKTVPIANRAYRLRAYQRVLDDAMQEGDFQNALRALTSAANEIGDLGAGAVGIETSNTAAAERLSAMLDQINGRSAESRSVVN